MDDAFMTDVAIDGTRPLEWLKGVMAELKQIPEAHVWFKPEINQLKIILQSTDYYHGRCPHSSHAFCHGWIMRGIVDKVHELLGEEATWVQCEWSAQTGRITKIEEDTVHFELRKVPLHGPPLPV